MIAKALEHFHATVAAFATREGVSVPLANGVTFAAITVSSFKDWTMWIGQLILIIGTVHFTYYKVRKMKAEAMRAERDAATP